MAELKYLMYPLDHVRVAHAMIAHGGGFVKCLGEAILHADHTNAWKIKDTWPQYWKEYAEVAREEAKRK